MNSYKNAFLILMVFLLASCNKNIKNLFDRNTTTKLVVNEVNFDFLSAKAKVNFDGEKDYSLSSNFRMQKDSVIWMSLSLGLGLEVARVMITKDSISVLDKLNKDYKMIDYQTISKKYDFDINFNLIQSVILGNLIFPYDREQVVKNEDMYAYAQKTGNYQFENYIGALSMKLEKLNVKDYLTKNEISVRYDDFQLVGEEIFPFKIFTLLEYGSGKKKSTHIDIEFNKINIESKPLKFPFSVPQRYE